MRLLTILSALAACNLGLTAAELDHEKLQRSLEARTWARETRDLTSLAGQLKTCNGCKVGVPVFPTLFMDFGR